MKHKKLHHKKYHYHYGLIHRVELLFVECLMLVLVLGSLGLLAFSLFLNPTAEQLATIKQIDTLIAGLLLVEFSTRLVLSKHRSHYLHHNWWYLLAALPIPLSFATGLRSVRLFGFVRMLKVGIHILFEKNLLSQLSKK
ncbi:hypothetical protein BH23PAT2_BH23PAT2_08450 [soil metagenome]